MILGFDGSSAQNVFVAQKGLESKVDAVLKRISQMQRLSCSGGQMPTVRVSVVANTPSGPVEAFEFTEYQPELFEKFQNMRAQHPYVLTADTLKLYQDKFRQSAPDSVKVSGAPVAAACAVSARGPVCRAPPVGSCDAPHARGAAGPGRENPVFAPPEEPECSTFLVLLALFKLPPPPKCWKSVSERGCVVFVINSC